MAGAVTVFGIRHHGPGSARTLVAGLRALQPDALLVEGPPDANDLIPLVAGEGMQPPVALLLYDVAAPHHAVFYPFARFSPEWQALKYGVAHGCSVEFMDLATAHRMAMDDRPDEAAEPPPVCLDPLGQLAVAAGFSDGERWWEHVVEHRRDASLEVFAAVREAMTELRQDESVPVDRDEPVREAAMRKCIRAAKRRGHERIAVVCGAWHAPALDEMPSASSDQQLLKGLSKVKVNATWVPWTHQRLSAMSGYGAGVRSPGWYDHLWQHEDGITERWLTRVARLLRAEDIDASSAHVIEASRLATALAAMRHRAIPGLDELTEATEAVFCAGDPTPLELIAGELIVGSRLGSVPEDAPTVPLQDDLQKTARRLRMKMSADEQDLDLDLRKPVHLDRSHTFHRLLLLGVPWGEKLPGHARDSTFHEWWRVQWRPEFAVRIIDAARWGNTIPSAATSRVRAVAHDAESIRELAELMDSVLLADLPEAATALVDALQAKSAVEKDVMHLMTAFCPLAQVTRYGNVRKTDTEMLTGVLEGLSVRICIGLPPACRSIGEDAAAEVAALLREVNSAMAVLTDVIGTERWTEGLRVVAEDDEAAPVIGGRACRLLLDAGGIDSEIAGTRLSLALSRAAEPPMAAAWIEGFLEGSGLVLLHDERLWSTIDDWIRSLPDEHFDEIVPVLRRTFSGFPAAERRMIGERLRSGGGDAPARAMAHHEADAERAFDVVELILSLGEPDGSSP